MALRIVKLKSLKQFCRILKILHYSDIFILTLPFFLEKMTGKKDVLVIGAGPAGMVTVAALKEHCNVKVIINQREIIKMNPKFSLKITSSN